MSLDAARLQRLLNELDAAKKGMAKAQRLLDALAGKNFPVVTLSLDVAPARRESGFDKEEHAFRLVDCDHYSHGARVSPGREVLHAHLKRFAEESRIAWASRVEGLEFQIRKAAK